MNSEPLKTIAETKFLRLVERGSWSFVQRQSEVRIVAVVAVTNDGKLILVEQYRPPTDSRVIELPAGLAGDIVGQESESLQIAAERELLEETGYSAAKWKPLTTVTSSAGLTDERVAIFLARELQKTGPGGGDFWLVNCKRRVRAAVMNRKTSLSTKFRSQNLKPGLPIRRKTVSTLTAVCSPHCTGSKNSPQLGWETHTGSFMKIHVIRGQICPLTRIIIAAFVAAFLFQTP